jgi:2-polyprenyl-6-methoxyphenol hydroxylase-like FAD-dependent oxidoreductase
MKTIFEKGKELPIIHSSDLGGGPAGISAAISAARMGAEVTLIDLNFWLYRHYVLSLNRYALLFATEQYLEKLFIYHGAY